MVITREYFTRIGFVKAVEALSEIEDIDDNTKALVEKQNPRIEELRNYFDDYRNRNTKDDMNIYLQRKKDKCLKKMRDK